MLTRLSISEDQLKSSKKFLSTLHGQLFVCTPLNTLGVVIGASIRGNSIGNEVKAMFTASFLVATLAKITHLCFSSKKLYDDNGQEIIILPSPPWFLFVLCASIAISATPGTLLFNGDNSSTKHSADKTAIDTAIGCSVLIAVSAISFFGYKNYTAALIRNNQHEAADTVSSSEPRDITLEEVAEVDLERGALPEAGARTRGNGCARVISSAPAAA